MHRKYSVVGLGLLLVLSAASAAPAAKPGDWPQWRGVGRDGRSAETGLLAAWPEGGPEVAWKNENVGASFSTVSVAEGRVFTMGNVDGEGRILCLDEETGQTLWSVRSPAEKRVYTHGRGDGARGTPTVEGNLVYAVGGGGDVTCLKAENGEVIWGLHLLEDLNGGGRRAGRTPGWGYSESPLIDGEKVIVTPGGPDGTVAALNKYTGNVVWRSAGVTDGAHYASAIAADVHGVHQIIQFTDSRVVGLEAETGKLLWDYAKSANSTANVCTPIHTDGYVFSSSAYGTGGGLANILLEDDAFRAEEVYFVKDMANHHGGIVLLDGYLYGYGRGLICMEMESGEIAWRARGVDKGSLCYADGHLYFLSEKNRVHLIEATPEEFVETGRFDIPASEKPSWAHPVVANGRLYIRDQGTLTAYEIGK